jgi:hypothetical protein
MPTRIDASRSTSHHPNLRAVAVGKESGLHRSVHQCVRLARATFSPEEEQLLMRLKAEEQLS